MEHKIVVRNTCIEVNDYNFGDCTKLENCFRIYDMITHSHYYVGLYYNEELRKLYLPRGIDIWFIEKLLNENAYVEKNMYNPFDKFTGIKVNALPRDEDQLKAFKFMIGAGEYTETTTKSQLQLNLNTGKGKTYCSIATMSYLGIKSVVITDAVTILSQWRASILKYTNMLPKNIYYIDGSMGINRVMKMSDRDLSRINVFLISHATIQSYATDNGWESIGELFKKMRVGLKFYDEAHKNFSNMLMIDFFTTVYKTYYITATPERSNSDENRIYQMAFKNVLCIDLFHRDSDPHTKYIAIRYNSRPMPTTISYCKNKYGLDRNKYTDYIVNNGNFRMVATVVLDLAFKLAPTPQEKVLIYIGTNNAILQFKAFMMQMFPMYANDIGIFTSTQPKEDKEIALTKKKIILSTTKSTGTAVDIKGLKVTIVLAEPFKSPVLARQTLGRTRDKNTYYLEVVDKGFIHCNQYFLSKRNIFEVYAESCQLIDISDAELAMRFSNVSNKIFPYIPQIPEVLTQSKPMIRPFMIKPFTIG